MGPLLVVDENLPFRRWEIRSVRFDVGAFGTRPVTLGGWKYPAAGERVAAAEQARSKRTFGEDGDACSARDFGDRALNHELFLQGGARERLDHGWIDLPRTLDEIAAVATAVPAIASTSARTVTVRLTGDVRPKAALGRLGDALSAGLRRAAQGLVATGVLLFSYGPALALLAIALIPVLRYAYRRARATGAAS